MQPSLSGRQSSLGQPREKEESFPPLPGIKAESDTVNQPSEYFHLYTGNLGLVVFEFRLK